MTTPQSQEGRTPELRRASADYTCINCGGSIKKGSPHHRTRGRSNGARTSIRSHLICPRNGGLQLIPEAPDWKSFGRVAQRAAQQAPMPPIGSPEYDELRARAARQAQARIDAYNATSPAPVFKSSFPWIPVILVIGGLLLAAGYVLVTWGRS